MVLLTMIIITSYNKDKDSSRLIKEEVSHMLKGRIRKTDRVAGTGTKK